ncbi:MAG: epoxide hydrolase family protein [Planctomycetaceae bacterium]
MTLFSRALHHSRFGWLALVAILSLGGPPACCGADETDAVRPFKIEVPEADLVDLRERLTRTRWPDALDNSGWTYGADLAYMQQLVEYWRTTFDWRAQEQKLNQFPQFKTRIDGLDLHFLHVRSKHADAMPLVLLHGWPGSFFEFYKMIGPLTDPTAHGGQASDAFHVVIPSLPGFGFSDKPREPGWSVYRMAEPIAKLMARLGYTRYAAQGGDWGSAIAGWLGRHDSEHVAGVHLSSLPVAQPAQNPWDGVSPAERERMEKRQKELQSHFGYAQIQGTRPLTIGYALNDSPVGQAAWIVDKFYVWSDNDGDLEKVFTKDELLTNVMIYWVTRSAPSSARIYFERGPYTGNRPVGKVPIGCALFPREIGVPPRKWVEAQLNVTHWTEMPRGGHFAALEAPDLLTDDVRKFFRTVR